ncbi:MAG: hypothetical protein KME05_10110 [Gloeocapsa sp. UFS-A4-WI-NPMV-4B04]|jgi:hypothetical protein|nr:hypothetical protein [Gloeocapsa sp. UFS-A4-WI-NPMV-4B04]
MDITKAMVRLALLILAMVWLIEYIIVVFSFGINSKRVGHPIYSCPKFGQVGRILGNLGFFVFLLLGAKVNQGNKERGSRPALAAIKFCQHSLSVLK